jgi:cell division protein FtsQ
MQRKKMRDFKGVRERIEPRFGNSQLEVDPPAKRSRRSAPERDSAAVDAEMSAPAARIMRDVLLDSTHDTAPGDYAPKPRARVAQREQGYTKVSPQGRRSERRPAAKKTARRWNFSWFNRRLAMGILVMGLAVGVYWVSEPLLSIFERPIKSVVVEGEFNLISKARATELIGNEIDGDFLQLNLMRLKEALLTDPWVEKVTLNRRWPDTLVVKIVEQKPIARWGDGFLNQRGEIVRVEDAARLSGLPWLQGNEADAIEILQQYQDLSQILRSRGLEVLALKCDNKKSWRLTVKNHVEIALGRDQVMEKIRRFVTVYDTKLNSVWTDVKAIDLRYSNGIAVRWVADSEMAKKYIKNRSAVGVALPAAKVSSHIN